MTTTDTTSAKSSQPVKTAARVCHICHQHDPAMNIPANITANITAALAAIGYDLGDIPEYRIQPGRIVIAISDNDDDESEATLAALRKALPASASAEWTGNSDTDGDGDTTSDCAITWAHDTSQP